MSGDAFFTNFLPAPARLFKEEQSTVVWVPPPAAGQRIDLKLYRHRGPWNALRCRVTRYRVQREHERLSHLARWDVPCTPPRGWSHGYSRECGFYELLATDMVPGARDLESHLKNGRECDFRPILAAIRRMHESGLCHHALYARNILISTVHASGETFAICDVPRSRIFPWSVVGTRMALFDLADLAITLMRLGVPRRAIPFDAYGLTPAESRRLAAMITGYPQSKFRRLLRDGESRIRHCLACLVGMLTGSRITGPRRPETNGAGIRPG